MKVESWIAGAALLSCVLTVGVVSLEPDPEWRPISPRSGTTTSHDPAPSIRHPELCGVALSGDLAASGEGPSLQLELVRADGRFAMAFDAATDHVDFVARGSGTAVLVAFDDRGRVVDVDTGPVAQDASATMQVTSDTRRIRAAQYYVASAASSGPATENVVSDLDVGSACP